METLNALLDKTAAEKPRAPALVWPAGGDPERAMSFEELRGKVLKAAAVFAGRGIGKGDRVAILHRNDPAFLVAYFGLARLGAAAVPINFLVQKPAELKFMLGHCRAKGIVAQREFLKGLLAARKELPGLKDVWCTDDPAAEGTESFWKAVDGADPLPGAAAVEPGDLACVLYTSGTTGSPKGVMLTHANLVSNCDAAILATGLARSHKGAVFLTLLPMFHTFAWTACVLVPLRLGLKNVLVASITPPAPWLKAMGRHRVSAFAAVPQIYALLAKQATGLKRLVLRWWFFRSVRLCISGAAPLSPRTIQDFEGAFGREILEGYGLTETSPVATLNPPGARRPGSVGLPIRDVSVRIVDEAGRDLPAGEEGEILLRGPNVMKGYLDDEKATREAIGPEGWFRTGDIGALDPDGYLYIRDRKKDMIIVKGLKVFSAQVEGVLLEHPDVQEAAVVGIPDAETGDETVKAFVVLREGASSGKADILRFARERLDPYKRPRDVAILTELPKNALQKTLKRVLREQGS